MAIRDAWMTGTTSFDAEEVRVAAAAPWNPATSAVKVQTGIKPGPGNPGNVTATGTPDGFVHVSAFTAIIQSSRAANAGAYTLTIDATVDINVLATPANSTNPRNDLIIAYVPDTFYGDANSTPVVRSVVGTPSGSPSDPSTAAFPDAVTLARVRVNANATTITTANITDLRPPATVAVGGVVPTNTATTRNALTGTYDGLTVYRRDRNWTEIHDGTAYRVESLPVVSSVADLSAITNPYAGLVASCTGDGLQYRYTGAAWVPHGLWRASTELASPASSISFTVPTTLKNLKIHFTARSSASALTDVCYLRVNNASTSNYLFTLFQTIGTSGGTTVNPGGIDKFFIGNIAGNTALANFFGHGTINITGWDAPHPGLGANWHTHIYPDSHLNAIMCTGSGSFTATGPYTTVQLFPTVGNNFLADTRVDIYGYE
jgi:hypothetical protein